MNLYHGMTMSKNLQDLWDEVEAIKTNHLAHMSMDIDHIKSNVERIENAVDKQDSKLDKMDSRLWWIFTIIVGSTFLGTMALIAKMLGVTL